MSNDQASGSSGASFDCKNYQEIDDNEKQNNQNSWLK